MKDEIKISIIIPIYNYSQNLKSSLDSIYKNITDISLCECVIVNDGSSDSETKSILEIIHEYQRFGLRINYIYQMNNGVSSARNKGLENAKGAYIYFLDSDDIIKADLVEIIKRQYVDDENLYFDLCINNTCIEHNLTGTIEVTNEVFSILFEKRVIHLSGIIFSKNLIGTLRFATEFSSAEDVLFLYKAVLGKKSNFRAGCISSYRYDGKLHKATKSGYVELVRLSKGTELHKLFYEAYQQRKFLHNSFFKKEFELDASGIPFKMKLLGFVGSKMLYATIQKIRYR